MSAPSAIMVSDPTQPANDAPEPQATSPTQRDKYVSMIGRAGGVAFILLSFVTCALTVTTLDNEKATHGPYYVMAFIFANLGLWFFIKGNEARKKIVAEEIRLFEEERQRRRQGPPTA